MDTSFAESNQPTFTAAIRWRGPDPSVDLETRYPGFRGRVEAARFAAGASGTSPQGLRLRPDGISLQLGHEGYVDYPYDLTIAWIRSQGGKGPFESHPLSDLLGVPSALGDYRRVGCAVLSPDGSPISIVIDFDNADRLEVRKL